MAQKRGLFGGEISLEERFLLHAKNGNLIILGIAHFVEVIKIE